MDKFHLDRRGLLVGLAVCCAALFGSASAYARTSKPPAPLTPGSRYLALGDSVTFGYEEAGVVPAPNYKNAASFFGYPEQFGSQLHVNVANAACPGETSSSLINAHAQSNGCENTPGTSTGGYRTVYPLHVHYTGSQLAYALSYLKAHRSVRLVSLMIGANDYLLCVETTKDACTGKSEVQGVVHTVAANVKTILSAIRNKAHYGGQLAIENYYSPNYASPTTNAQSQLLNSTVDNAAKPFRIVIGNGYAEFQAGSLHSAGSTCNAGLLTQLGAPGTCGIHPSYAGQALLAEALAKAVRL